VCDVACAALRPVLQLVLTCALCVIILLFTLSLFTLSTSVRAEHESRITELVQLHDRQLQQLQSTTAAARQQDATTTAQQLAALDTKYTATVTGLREALKQTRAKLKQLLSNSGSASSGGVLGGTATYRGATTASSRARY
jgi:uncharacterized phage infection (PIP) family protein YhgE